MEKNWTLSLDEMPTKEGVYWLYTKDDKHVICDMYGEEYLKLKTFREWFPKKYTAWIRIDDPPPFEKLDNGKA